MVLILIFCNFITASTFALNYGIDRLSEPSVIQRLQGKNLAVLTHAAAVNIDQKHLIDLLFKNYNLKKIFAPEHGLRSVNDDWVDDGIDAETQLPVISLYKHATRAPSAKDLEGIDAVVIDLQDVGVRYYTYFSTIAETMKACAHQNVEVILLDRPNLLGGEITEGKVLDQSLTGSFTAYHTTPTRHGMTLGELALMINFELNFGTQLTVIPVAHWKRENLLNNNDRTWIPSSPALVNLEQVGLYALWGTLENFNLAVGRGITNELAFKVIAAPWISEKESFQLAALLNELNFKTVTFTPYSWTVTRARYLGQKVNGVKIQWDGRETRTDEFTYKVASLLVKMFKGRISSANMSPQSYGSLSMVNAIQNETPWIYYQKIIDNELAAFMKRRAPYLLY